MVSERRQALNVGWHRVVVEVPTDHLTESTGDRAVGTRPASGVRNMGRMAAQNSLIAGLSSARLKWCVQAMGAPKSGGCP